jgi:hypothetical protein
MGPITRNGVKWVTTVVVVAMVCGLFLASEYYFAVPYNCGCRVADIPSTLSEASILDNSIADTRYITILSGDDIQDDSLSICYLEKPKRGEADPRPWPPECKWEMSGYELNERQVLGKSDILTVISYRVAGRNKGELGALVLDRNTHSCEFLMDAWTPKGAEPKRLSGKMECVNKKFYFNPWSLFPQNVELFYTRAFYAIHKGR